MALQLVSGLLAAIIQLPVVADPPTADAPPPVATTPTAVAGAKSYTPADFTRFAPRTALDMLNNVPGFTIRQQDDRRGLGQATANVILNGERFSGKSNDVVTELGRISASNVVRIDIVDGATLDIPGLSGQVANIVTASTGMSGTFAYNPEFRTRRLPALLTRGEASLNGKFGSVDYTVSVGDDSNHGGNNGPEFLYAPDGTVLDRRAEDLRALQEAPKISARLHRAGSDGTVWNLNGSGQYFRNRVSETSLRSGPRLVDRDRRVDSRSNQPTYEIGGDYEFATLGGKLKFIGLRRGTHTDATDLLTVDFADHRPSQGDRYHQLADEAETIARSEFRWKGGKADWQISFEGALNSLDIANTLASRDAAGIFQPVPFPDATSRVEEKRAEGVLSYGRALSKTVSLQSSAGIEYSELSQSGPAGLTRQFVRPKGQVSLAWKPSAKLDLSLKVERSVGQLNFFDFVASGSISSGTTNAGNANLVPPQSWDVTVQGTRNLGAWGTTTLRGYAEFISDIVDVIPIGTNGQSPGNLDRARRYGVQWTSTINFDRLGWNGAKLDADVTLQGSRLTDPLTGDRRPIGQDTTRQVQVTLRYDVPHTDWALGAGADDYRQSPGFRLDQRTLGRNSPFGLQLFVENKDVFGLTVRGSVFGLTHVTEAFERQYYDGLRTNALLFTESRARHYGLIFALKASGKF